MKRQWNIAITGSWTGWHAEQWDFRKNEKTMEHSDHWIVTGCRDSSHANVMLTESSHVDRSIRRHHGKSCIRHRYLGDCYYNTKNFLRLHERVYKAQ
jgi:hypothetical protein